MSMSCKQWGSLLAASLFIAACSASHDIAGEAEPLNGGHAGTNHAGSSAAGNAGGAGGNAGRAGSAGGAGNAGSTGMAPTVQCGGETCTGGSVLGFITFPACCSDADKCGLDLSDYGVDGCSEKGAAGKADSSCPGATIASFLPLSGCCRSDGTCGAMDTYIGLGCAAIGTDAGTCTP